MLPNFDVVCVGNAKIDAFLSIHKTRDHLRFNINTNEIYIKSGEKITVDKCEFLLGGNAANVAVGLRRLGLSSAICAEIGDDEFSQKIINLLKKERVSADLLQRSQRKASSFSVILNFKGERTIFSEHVDRLHNFKFDNLSTKCVYLTSLGHEWKKPYQKVFDFVKKTKCLLAFNPGTLQIEEGEKGIDNILSITDILFVNKEEAEKVLSIKYQVLSIKELLTQLQKLGPKVVVITNGQNGSYAIDERQEIFTHGAVPCRIIEKTGAGDAYSTGFLAAILHRASIKQAMAWGAVNAASVIEKVGAQTGLLKKENIEEKLNEISNS